MKILFIRFSAIGDLVLASPAFRCAKNQLPGVELHLLTKANLKAVTEANPYIDRFHYFDGDFGSTLADLKAENFDWVVDLHKNLRSYRFRWALKKPSLAYKKASIEKWWLTKWHWDRMPQRHISLRSVDALAPLGVQYDGQGLDYFIPKETQWPNDLEGKQALLPGICLVLGASYPTKKMPLEKWSALAKALPKPLYVLGGPEEADAAETLRMEGVIPLAGKLTLHQSALLVSKAPLVISHDTGLLYMACAFGVPSLAIWGATSPILQVEPWYAEALNKPYFNAIVPGLTCQPCSNFGSKQCPKGHFRCMQDQSVETLLSYAQELLPHALPREK